jgi:hypothetical protein
VEKIFIVTNEQVETRGHGQFGKIKVLSTYNGYDEKQYPAFSNKEDAHRFIDRVSEYWKPQVTELLIWKGETNYTVTDRGSDDSQM